MKGIGLIFSSAMLATSALAQGIVSNRTTLDAILGANRADEDFETPTFQTGTSVGADGPLSSTNLNGFGPNLVIPGITFEGINSSDNIVVWNGDDFGPGTSQALRAYVGLRLDFWNPTKAFGIDLKDYPSTRTVLTAGITVYGIDDLTVLYNGTIDIADPANGVFFGFQDPVGIGSVIFSDAITGPYWNNISPFIDNLSFSTAPIPEPSTFAFALIGLGALAWRIRQT